MGFYVLQCVAVCCSVLQCVAVCCSVLQCVAACCSVLQCQYESVWDSHSDTATRRSVAEEFKYVLSNVSSIALCRVHLVWN